MLIRPQKPQVFALLNYAARTREVARFHNSSARIRIPCAPARTSKSLAAAVDVAAEIIPAYELDDRKRAYPVGPSKLVWVVAPDYKTNKEFDYLYSIFVEGVFYNDRGVLVHHSLRDLFEYQIEKKSYSPKQGNMELVIHWGQDREGRAVRTVIEGKSATNPESLQGEEVDIWVQSEAAEHDPKIWARYGSTRARRVLLPTTPKISGAWLKELIDMGDSVAHQPECDPPECAPGCPVVGQVGVEWFQFTPHANPTYDWNRYWQEHAKAESRVEGRIISAANAHDCFDPGVDCRAMRDSWFAEQFGGRWTFEADRVLPFRWTDEHGPCHVIDQIPAWFHAARYYVAFDHGYTDPACVLWAAIGTDGTTLLYREIYEAGMDPRQLVNRVLDTSDRFGERIDMFVPDPQRPEVGKVLRELGLPLISRKSSELRDRAAGHARIVSALSTDPRLGRPKLYVLSEKASPGFGCPRTIAEWKTLRRKEKVGGNEFGPTAYVGADHAFDACRYLLMAHPQAPSSEDYRIDEEMRRIQRRHAEVMRVARYARAFDARYVRA